MAVGRFRKVYTSMYGDRRFNSLSRPQPNAQSLWLFLITGPHTSAIPGLSTIGELGLAEMLGWEMEGFRKAFREVSSKGMARADWAARVLWIPNAIRYNEPESPNVITGWRKAWDDIPESDLKAEAIKALREYIAELPTKKNTWVKAFQKAFPEAYREGSPNQEQEQEQEQEQDVIHTSSISSTAATGGAEQAKSKGNQMPRPEDRIYDAYPRKVGRQDALREIVRARGIVARAGELDPWGYLFDRTQQYAAVRNEIHQQHPDERQFTPHPSTWFHQGRYQDDPAEWAILHNQPRRASTSTADGLDPEDARMIAEMEERK